MVTYGVYSWFWPTLEVMHSMLASSYAQAHYIVSFVNACIQAVHKKLALLWPRVLAALDAGDAQAISTSIKQLEDMYSNAQVGFTPCHISFFCMHLHLCVCVCVAWVLFSF